LRTESLGTVQEVRLKDRLQDQQRRRLHHAIPDRRDAERSQLAVGLGEVDPPHRGWLVTLGPQVFLKGFQEFQRSPVGVADRVDRDPVAARCALMGADPVPSRSERVPPIDPVLQGVKPALRLLLRLLAQLLPQKRACRRQRPVVRSGILRIQAVLPSSCSHTYLARPLRSTGVTLLPRYYEPRRLPTGAGSAVMSSHGPLDPKSTPSGLPGSSVDPSTRAVPNHPGEPGRCMHPFPSRPVTGFTIVGRLAPLEYV